MSGRAWPMQRYGDAALLVDVPDLDGVLALHAGLLAAPAPGQVDVVPAARTVLIRLETGADLDAVRAHVAHVELRTAVPAEQRQVEIDVVYDGPDLAEVGTLTGLGPDGVVAAHTGANWTVAFDGFAPGFAYLVGDTSSLSVPRRATSRPRIAAGTVGLAGEFSGVYPRASPGGWQLIGRTDAPLWRADRDPPALLGPGASVRFRQVDELAPVPLRDDSSASADVGRGWPSSADATGGLRVRDPGPLMTVQDLGRIGYGALGVPVSGPTDRDAAAAANRLVDNPDTAAVLEVTLGRARLQAVGDQLVAVRGAVPTVTVESPDGVRVQVDPDDPISLKDGDVLRLGGTRTGLRTYVAVAGGIGGPAVLGSRSTDTLSGLGPPHPRRGDLLPVVDPPSDPEPSSQSVDGAPADRQIRLAPGVSGPIPSSLPVTADSPQTPILRIEPGPRRSRFVAGAMYTLVSTEWTVRPDSDRVGLRLGGNAPLRRIDDSELPSEGLVAGAVQVPPSGEPVIFLSDHPVTGGYPVLAVVAADDLGIAAQARPGRRLRFRLA